MHRIARTLALLLVIAFFSGWLLAAPPEQPRLVVVVVIDQFRADYLDRFRDRYGPGGFRMLFERGANFTRCEYPFAATVTSVGHATLFTGTYPPWHGIIGNTWYDRERKGFAEVVKNERYPLIGAGEATRPGGAPLQLRGTTLGDELRLATQGRARVIGVSVKDHAIVLGSGKSANGAFWFDYDSGNFVSSTYYMSHLPTWAAEFNARHPADRFSSRAWEAPAKPGEKPTVLLALTSKSGKPDKEFYDKLALTPFMSEVQLDFARAAVRGEELGKDATPDLLIVSISSNDLLGHQRGPYSRDVEEMSVTTDKLLADFFRFLDREVGLANVVIAVTADHGIAPTIEQSREHKIEAKNIPSKAVVDVVAAALERRFGKGDWIEKFSYPDGFGVPDIYLNHALLEERKVNPEEVERVAGQAAMTVEGIDGYFTATQLASGQLPQGGLARKYALSYNIARSGDVALVVRPFWMIEVDANRTKHGSPYAYSAHVPMILLGRAFRAGVYATACSPADLAPTLAQVLGLTAPSGAVGRVLTEALVSPVSAPAAPATTRRPARTP